MTSFSVFTSTQQFIWPHCVCRHYDTIWYIWTDSHQVLALGSLSVHIITWLTDSLRFYIPLDTK